LWFSIYSISNYIRLKYKFNHVITVIIILCALAKSGSFGFAEASALCVGAKPNVPLVRLAKIVFKSCGSAKKIKHEALGCRVGKKSAVKFICRPVVSIISVSLMVVGSSVTLCKYP
jgi:hypothetical protein